MRLVSPALVLLMGALSLPAAEPGPSGALAAAANDQLFPQRSPWACVQQTIGTTVITIEYHRPAVRGRAIWGALVPYHQVWRAGANEATTIRFSDTVRIHDQEVKAGTYSIFMIPRPDVWTVILNRRAKQWGAFEYDPKQDLIRFEVKPRPNAFTNWLSFALDPTSDSTAYVQFLWEKLKVNFLVGVNVEAITAARMKKLFAQRPNDWKVYCQAAEYALTQAVPLHQALEWVDRSLSLQENATNLAIKARLLYEAGQLPEAIELMERALRRARAARQSAATIGPMERDLSSWRQGQ
ncbi:MAG TPA: hypothetical protein DHV93_11550 [Holophagaceae bacterium]|nr:hypothetical protein [Holophagaceae bacterium]